MSISERLAALRCEMKAAGIDMYYVPSADYHGSEYVGDYFKCREYIIGFNGSAGDVIVTADSACLWTDGRYFIQAEKELAGSSFVLYKSGQKGVPTVLGYIRENLHGGVLGFDGKAVSVRFSEAAGHSAGRIVTADLFDRIWTCRPPMPAEKAFCLSEKYYGKSFAEKLSDIRSAVKKKNADICLLFAPDEICWLLNVRGNDILYNPVVLSFGAVEEDKFYWFVDDSKLSHDCFKNLDGVIVRSYEDFYKYIADIPSEKTILADKSQMSFEALNAVPRGVKVVYGQSPAMLLKAIKDPVETANERLAHLKDGIAMTKFIYRIKKSPESYTELSAAELLVSLRQEQENYIEESFAPIIAYGEHGAIVHYSADEQSSVPFKREGFLLCDTGGHYLEGTTDVTRTICLGKPSAEMKKHYTAVLRGHLNLAGAVFRYGCTGVNLDICARAPLWELGMDFNHGTGHGVGYLLNVHESPNSIRMKCIPDRDCILEEGMITSDEPGLYIEGKYGIRTESLLLCRKGEKNSFGQFMYFENLTLVPFDPDAVDFTLMSEREIALYKAYQQRVYKELSPYLEPDEEFWLKEETSV